MFWDSVNKELICAAAAWLAAQLIKCIICLVVNRSLPLNIIFGSGGMPLPLRHGLLIDRRRRF